MSFYFLLCPVIVAGKGRDKVTSKCCCPIPREIPLDEEFVLVKVFR